MSVCHHAVDDLRRVLGVELELVAFLPCLVHHRDPAQLVKPRRRAAVKGDLDRLDALNRLFQPFGRVDGGDVTLVDDRHPVAEDVCLLDVVRRQENGDSSLDEVAG